MQKLRLNVFERMIQKRLTATEINYLIYNSRFQDESGQVCGVYYKDVCSALDISYQTFYDIQRSLQNKGFIRVSKNNYYDYDIRIIGNDCSNLEEVMKEGYINTNHDIFFSTDFFGWKANEKLLAMQFMMITFKNQASYQIGTDKFLKKYTGLFQVSVRVIRSYLKSLKKFFSIRIKERKYFVTPKKCIYHSPKRCSEALNQRCHQVKISCRRAKIQEIEEKDLEDTAKLYIQYRTDIQELQKAGSIPADFFQWLLDRSVQWDNPCHVPKKGCKRRLLPKLAHKILRSTINAFYKRNGFIGQNQYQNILDKGRQTVSLKWSGRYG